MSLAELRAMAEAEENQEVETTEEQLDLVDELESQDEETETVDAENEESEVNELDDFELEDDEPEQKPKFDAKAALTHKLTKQRKRAQKAESEVEQLRREIDQLKASVGKPQQPVQQAPRFEYGSSAPVPPDRWSADINGDEQKFAQANAQYMADWNEWQQAQLAPQQQAAKQQSDYQDMIAKKAQLLSDDAAMFIQDNKVKAEVVINAIETAKEEIDEAAGLDGAFVHLLGSLDSGAAKAAYHIGRNETARNKLKELLASDSSGLKAVNYLTKLTSLKPKTKIQSKAPEPDEPIKGNANSVTAERLKAMYDKETDMSKMVAMRKKARSMGISLD